MENIPVCLKLGCKNVARGIIEKTSSKSNIFVILSNVNKSVYHIHSHVNKNVNLDSFISIYELLTGYRQRPCVTFLPLSFENSILFDYNTVGTFCFFFVILIRAAQCWAIGLLGFKRGISAGHRILDHLDIECKKYTHTRAHTIQTTISVVGWQSATCICTREELKIVNRQNVKKICKIEAPLFMSMVIA